MRPCVTGGGDLLRCAANSPRHRRFGDRVAPRALKGPLVHRISRRDFLNGMMLTVASGLSPAQQVAADPRRYPPALTGLRGQHPGSFEVAHALARGGEHFPIADVPTQETYDLLVVGAGISGLAAAWFYRRALGPSARILFLDNHDDFGGHAKRNEFTFQRRLILCYGG